MPQESDIVNWAMSIRPKQQGGFQGGLSGTAPGPQRAQSRTTTQWARTLGVPAGSGHIANLHSTIAKVGFCRMPAFYLPVAGSRPPEMAI